MTQLTAAPTSPSARTEPLRILLSGLGPLGQLIAKDLGQRGLGTIVAAVDRAPELAGKSLADAIPGIEGGAEGAEVFESAHDVMNAGFDRRADAAIVATASDLSLVAPTLTALLARGMAVVSTCEELVYPWLRHAAIAEDLDAIAKRHGGRVVGTGVNPGFMMDTLPVALTAVCRSVHAVTVYRIQDAVTRRVPFQQKIGAGLDAGQFEAKVRDGALRHVGLGESLHFIAHYLGLPIARWEETIEPVIATREMHAGIGPVLAGRAAGVRQTATAYDEAGKRRVRLEFQAAIGQPDPHDRVVIDGDPPIDMTIRGGVHGDTATSAITLNAIGPLLDAPPGLHTMATIRPARFQGRRIPEHGIKRSQ